ncbi:hypothetical protein QQS21_004247 [Conoideocrella luteorostrata]|uniref:NmrA-like domain-containing protein n=1 Tax=Conoideocrella luteorostrata TaxID=1105319 RepID=A0AAJ0FZY4_9HYPO|nr:hypothetical protein QQS21_004247 [Conoideocrella luteorostrata]
MASEDVRMSSPELSEDDSSIEDMGDAYEHSLDFLFTSLEAAITDAIGHDASGWANNNVQTALQLHDMLVTLRHWEDDIKNVNSKVLQRVEIDDADLSETIRSFLVEITRDFRKLQNFYRSTHGTKDKAVNTEVETALLERMTTSIRCLIMQAEPLRVFLDASERTGMSGKVHRASLAWQKTQQIPTKVKAEDGIEVKAEFESIMRGPAPLELSDDATEETRSDPVGTGKRREILDRVNKSPSRDRNFAKIYPEGREEKHMVPIDRSVKHGMRIAVAGGGGLGYLLALQLSQAAVAYNVVVLSRSERPEFQPLDAQLHLVDYSDEHSLTFALQGVDLVISTISGTEQVSLINAAGRARVRHFVPSEYEGPLSKRPLHDDPLDRGSAAAIVLLNHWESTSRMRYTVFTCGIFMERFHPYGLGYLNIGYGSGVSAAGDYLLDINGNTAEYGALNSKGHIVRICLTSVYDLVRFIVAAIDLGPGNWPHEFTMRGDRMSVEEVVRTCSRVRNVPFNHYLRTAAELQSYLTYYDQSGDGKKAAYYQRLVATANGRYDFSVASLNGALEKQSPGGFQPMTFFRWLAYIGQSL